MSWKTVKADLQPDGSYLLNIDGKIISCEDFNAIVAFLAQKEEADGKD